VEAYKKSYIKELEKLAIPASEDRDSYAYFGADSWLFDYERKGKILGQVFDKCIIFPYQKEDIIKVFLEKIGYSAKGSEAFYYNRTDYR